MRADLFPRADGLAVPKFTGGGVDSQIPNIEHDDTFLSPSLAYLARVLRDSCQKALCNRHYSTRRGHGLFREGITASPSRITVFIPRPHWEALESRGL